MAGHQRLALSKRACLAPPTTKRSLSKTLAGETGGQLLLLNKMWRLPCLPLSIKLLDSSSLRLLVHFTELDRGLKKKREGSKRSRALCEKKAKQSCARRAEGGTELDLKTFQERHSCAKQKQAHISCRKNHIKKQKLLF